MIIFTGHRPGKDKPLNTEYEYNPTCRSGASERYIRKGRNSAYHKPLLSSQEGAKRVNSTKSRIDFSSNTILPRTHYVYEEVTQVGDIRVRYERISREGGGYKMKSCDCSLYH
jgi:hypothetical protein